MATKINFKSVINSVWYGIKQAGMAIAIAVLVVLIFAVFYCWPAFILWSIFAPRKAAQLLYAKKNEELLPVMMQIVQYLNGWIVWCLPMFWKKHFMEERGIENYSSDLQVKYYFKGMRTAETVRNMSKSGYKSLWCSDKLEPKDYNNLMSREGSKEFFGTLLTGRQVRAYHLLGNRVEVIEMMSDDAVEMLWDTSRDLTNDYANVVIAGKVLDDCMFAALVREVPLMVMKYVEKHTPSDQMMTTLFARKDNFVPVIRYCICKYGMSPKSIRSLESLGLLDEFEDSLREFMERTFIQRHASESDRKLVKAFFEERRELCVEAQKIMKPWQYRLFHEAGLRIDESVLESFIEKEDVPMLKVIFELDPEIKSSDIAGAMAMANPTITDLVMNLAK